MSRAIICWQSPNRAMFEQQSADCTNHQNPEKWRTTNEKLQLCRFGWRENQVKHRSTVTWLAKFKPLRPTVWLRNANTILMETKNPRSMRKSIFFVLSVTATENRHDEQLCAEGSLGTGYWIKLIYVIYWLWHDIEMDPISFASAPSNESFPYRCRYHQRIWTWMTF